ncbi:fused toxin protein-like [Anolis sagrei]|uniref:fused toxin protein-like n=1 Tax=Anolis sagrei TaxID=38937 RepID=UPI003521571D
MLASQKGTMGSRLLLFGLLLCWAGLSSANKKRDICLLPPEPGKCEAYMPSFFFNATSGKCEKFIYGGCDGNENRFGTEKRCLQACPVKPGVCPARTPPGEIDPCFFRCSRDYECPDRKKCCRIECGPACVDPVPEKPGKCPVPPKGTVAVCLAKCTFDHDCLGHMKCCDWGCMKDCFNPVFGESLSPRIINVVPRIGLEIVLRGSFMELSKVSKDVHVREIVHHIETDRIPSLWRR